MNRKLIIIFIFPLILVSWMIYSCKQPIVLKGKSSDGNWRAEYSPHHSPNPKGIWKGEATWLGGTNLPTLNFWYLNLERKWSLYTISQVIFLREMLLNLSVLETPRYMLITLYKLNGHTKTRNLMRK